MSQYDIWDYGFGFNGTKYVSLHCSGLPVTPPFLWGCEINKSRRRPRTKKGFVAYQDDNQVV